MKDDKPKNERKTVCIAYETGKSVIRAGTEYPETKLLTVGSAFGDAKGRIKGTFLAIPPQWDGKFLILDPLPKNGPQETGSGPDDSDYIPS
jgi:hypothetical protein